MWSAQARQRREYALELEAVARLAHRRRRRGELATADGRGGPGVDARASADPLLAGVREDFVAELAVSRDCSEAEAAVLLREALHLTGRRRLVTPGPVSRRPGPAARAGRCRR